MRSRSACAGSLGGDVDRAQRLGQRRDRLHRHARDQRLAGRHAALEAAGAVRLAVVAALLGVEDLVVGLRAGPAREVEPVAEPDALGGLDRQQRARDQPVHPLLPGHVRAEARARARTRAARRSRRSTRSLAQDVDLADHRLRRLGVEAAHRATRRRRRSRPARARSQRRRLHRPDLRHVRDDLDTPSARRNALASAPPATRAAVSRAEARSKHVAHVGEAELLHAREVGVPGARQMDLGHVGLDRPRVHPLFPVLVVAVGDLERDRAAQRAPVADPGGDRRGVLLDLHPPAAAVAELAAREVAVDRLLRELQARGQALHDRGQARPV